MTTTNATTAAAPISGGPGPVTQSPNLYSLHSNVIQGGQFSLYVVYSTSSIAGKPLLEYHDSNQMLSFSGDQIGTTDSPLGTLVTVTTRMTIDNGSTTFTLFVPRIRLVGQSSNINTFGVTTIHRFSVVPALNLGQTELYAVTELLGTAELVTF
jgi:hypothetical protein